MKKKKTKSTKHTTQEQLYSILCIIKKKKEKQ